MQSTHLHPNMSLNRVIHTIMGGVLVLALVSVPLQFLMALTIPAGFMFFITGILTLFLSLPLVLLLFATPPVTFNGDKVTLHPRVWRPHSFTWDEVQMAKAYPLLPSEETETVRRLFVGRRKYRPAEGIMLVVPSLPFPYRIVGFFAGTGSKPAVAFTNRSHTEYERLVQEVARRFPAALSD